LQCKSFAIRRAGFIEGRTHRARSVNIAFFQPSHLKRSLPMLRGIPLLLAGVMATSLLATETDAMPHMAVVNISQVFNAYARVRAAETELDKIFGPQRAEMAAEKKKLQLWEDKIKLDIRDIKTNLDFYKEVPVVRP
jgi:hypothetical protein